SVAGLPICCAWAATVARSIVVKIKKFLNKSRNGIIVSPCLRAPFSIFFMADLLARRHRRHESGVGPAEPEARGLLLRAGWVQPVPIVRVPLPTQVAELNPFHDRRKYRRQSS